MVEAFVRGLKETTKGHAIELVAAVDADPDTRERLVVESARLGRFVLDYRADYRGCSRAWNDALALSTGDPVILAADDLVFEAGWLDAALAQMAEFGEGGGLVGFNDGHGLGPDLSTHYMVSRQLIVQAFGGVIAWEEYKHSFNDEEACARAKVVGRYAWCETARVTHRHWIFGSRAQDDTDARNLGSHPASQAAFAARAAAGFPNDYLPVIS